MDEGEIARQAGGWPEQAVLGPLGGMALTQSTLWGPAPVLLLQVTHLPEQTAYLIRPGGSDFWELTGRGEGRRPLPA